MAQPPICPKEFKEAEEACPHCWDTAGAIQVPVSTVDVVRKDECVYCCNTNAHHEGIFVCMKCFQGVCGAHLQKHVDATQHPLYVLVYKEAPTQKKPEKFQDIGQEEPPNFTASLVCAPCGLRHIDGVGETFDAMLGIVHSEPPRVVDALTEDMWMQKTVCPHCDPVDSSDAPVFSPSNPPPASPPCMYDPECGHTDNNWMCLSCGFVSCPRREAGGKGHAIRHSQDTGHPLVVKLGTVTPTGADIHCYTCDKEVIVATLKTALQKIGIDQDAMKKTAKSLAEMQFDQALKYDSWHITEAGADLEPAGGPGRTGLRNFGNTCYMNSIVQVCFGVKQWRDRFSTPSHIAGCKSATPLTCFECQMEKLGTGLQCGEFSLFPKDEDARQRFDGITPRDFKKLIAGTHADFSTGQQQDASEYFGYLMTQCVRKDFANPLPSPTLAFELTVERRTGCVQCQGCKYSRNREWTLRLPVPVEPFEPPLGPDGQPVKMTDAEIEANRPKTTLDACLKKWAESDFIDGVTCQGCHQKSAYAQTTHLTTFPDVIPIVVAREYFCRRTFQAKKLDVLVDVPDELDLEFLRRTPADGETVWEASEATPQASTLGADTGAAAAIAHAIREQTGKLLILMIQTRARRRGLDAESIDPRVRTAPVKPYVSE